MRLARFDAIVMFLAAVAMLDAGVAAGQGYPNKPIRIVTSAPGGGSDFASRVISFGLTENLGQQVVIDNRGNSAADIVAKSSPDGYTLLVDGASMWIGPLLLPATYDPVKDFSPVTAVTSSPSILVLHPSVTVSNVKDLVALAKAKPGTINYGSGGVGSSSHLGAELLKAMAGIDITRINYKGSGPAINGLVGGEVQLMITASGPVSALIKAGKLKALALTSAQPSALFPGMPTIAASGVPGYEAVSKTGMFAPVKTPPPVVSRLSQETVRVLNRADIKERLFNFGVEGVAGPPEQFAAEVKAEMAKWAKVIKSAGITNK